MPSLNSAVIFTTYLAAAAFSAGCFEPVIPAISCSEENPSCPRGYLCVLSELECREVAAPEQDGGGTIDGRTDAALTDDGLVARYFIDEATEGSEPMELVDSAASPRNLELRDSSNFGFAVDSNGNRALTWSEAGREGGADGSVSGTKFAALTGSRAFTYEVVATIVRGGGSEGSRLACFSGQGRGELCLRARGSDRLEVIVNNSGAGRFIHNDLDSRRVIHMVFDTAAAAASSRLRVFVDGVELENDSNDNLDLNESLRFLAPGLSLTIGNRQGGSSSLSGSIGYVALYDQAISETTIAKHVARLLASDDQ